MPRRARNRDLAPCMPSPPRRPPAALSRQPSTPTLRDSVITWMDDDVLDDGRRYTSTPRTGKNLETKAGCHGHITWESTGLTACAQALTGVRLPEDIGLLLFQGWPLATWRSGSTRLASERFMRFRTPYPLCRGEEKDHENAGISGGQHVPAAPHARSAIVRGRAS